MALRPHEVRMPQNMQTIARVETALLSDPTVADCVVLPRVHSDGTETLVAYVAMAKRCQPEGLRRRLAAAVAPTAEQIEFVQVSDLPRLSDGSVDTVPLSDLPVITAACGSRRPRPCGKMEN